VDARISGFQDDGNRIISFSNSVKSKIVDRVLMITGNKDNGSGNNSVQDSVAFSRIHSRPIIKVQEGCSCFCSYCVVPFLRGAPRSIKYYDIRKEIEQKVFEYPCEIVLTGTNIGLYRDPVSGSGLAHLMRRILGEFHQVYIRLSSIELGDTDEELIELFGHERIRNHLHIPLQSASDSVLVRMGRGYRYEDYQQKVIKLKELIPDIGITTDIMVGFPGESDEDFQMTCKAIKELEFLKIHVFRYSPRIGTEAASFDNQAPEDVKSIRSRYIIKLGDEVGLNFKKKFIGRKLSCAAEKMLRRDLYLGTSQNYIKLSLRGKNIKEGMILNCRVKREEGRRLLADVVDI